MRSNRWSRESEVLSILVMWDSESPWIVAQQAPLSMGLSRKEYWSGLPFPSPELSRAIPGYPENITILQVKFIQHDIMQFIFKCIGNNFKTFTEVFGISVNFGGKKWDSQGQEQGILKRGLTPHTLYFL